MISGTITDASGRTLSGQTVAAFWNSVRHARPFSIGLNCALGATELRPWLLELSKVAECPVSVHPNAGLPNELGEYDDTPENMAKVLSGFARDGLINLAGGCCGTRPEHISAIADALGREAPRIPPQAIPYCRLAGLEPFTITPELNFVNVGERTMGCTVDMVSHVIRIPDESIQPAPETVTADGANYISGFAKLDDRLVIVLDIDELLGPGRLEGKRKAALPVTTSSSQTLHDH